MSAYVIESEGLRLAIIENRFGGYSLRLDDVTELIEDLLEAQLRMLDPTPLPAPEPHSPKPRAQATPPRRLAPTTLDDLA